MKRKKKSLLDDEDFMVSPSDDEDLVVYELDYAGERIKLDMKSELLESRTGTDCYKKRSPQNIYLAGFRISRREEV